METLLLQACLLEPGPRDIWARLALGACPCRAEAGVCACQAWRVCTQSRSATFNPEGFKAEVTFQTLL